MAWVYLSLMGMEMLLTWQGPHSVVQSNWRWWIQVPFPTHELCDFRPHSELSELQLTALGRGSFMSFPAHLPSCWVNSGNILFKEDDTRELWSILSVIYAGFFKKV